MKKLTYSLTVFALGLGLISGCGKDDKEGQGNPAEAPAITDPQAIITASDRKSLVGRKVQIEHAVTDQVVGNYVFWIGTGRNGVPVVRQDKIRGPVTEHVRKGAPVRISGTVRFIESVSATDPLWDKISESEKQEIKGAQVYIDADRVMLIQTQAYDLQGGPVPQYEIGDESAE